MKIIVTGGCGFIGSHVVERCVHDGHEVIVLDNLSTGRLENLQDFKEQVQFVQCDLRLSGDWQNYFDNVDWVFHLAALADIVPSIKDPVSYYESNVTGTLHVLQSCLKYSIKHLVYAASASCYGIPTLYPTPETSPISPQYPYALTKYLGEQLVLHWHQVYQLPVTSLRFFNVYGPRSRTSGTYGAVFGVFLAQKLAGKPLTVVGDGNQTRDFLFVDDLVSALVLVVQSKARGRIYNVGTGDPVSVNRIAQLIGGEKIHIPKRPGEPDCTQADSSLIQAELGWTPQVSIEEGVQILLNHIDYWKSSPVWEPESIAEQTKEWFQFLGKNA